MASKVDITIKAKDEASPAIDGISDSLGGLNESALEVEETGGGALGNFMDKANETMLGVAAAIYVAKEAFVVLGEVYDATVGKTLEIANEIETLSRVSGDAPENMSLLRIEAEKAKVPFEDLYKAMENLNKNGVAPTVDNLIALAGEYVNLQDPIAQAKLLTENFGSAGDEIAPMLEAIAGGIESVDNAGLIFTQEEIDQANAYEEAVANLGIAWEGLATTIGMSVIPKLTDFFGQFQNTISSMGLLSEYIGLLNEKFGEDKNAIEYAKAIGGIMNVDLASAEGTELLRNKIDELDQSLHADAYAAGAASQAHDDLVMSIFNETDSWKGFQQAMQDAGLDMVWMTEEIYNQEKAAVEAADAINSTTLTPKILEINANDGPVKAKLEELARMGIEDKSFDVIAELDTSDVDGYQPPTKYGRVHYLVDGNNRVPVASGGIINAASGLAASMPYYWVGERGPEPFFPSQDGRIVSNTQAMAALRGGANAGDIADAVKQGIKEAMKDGSSGNVYNLTMPTSSNPADVRTAFELMEAWGA